MIAVLLWAAVNISKYFGWEFGFFVSPAYQISLNIIGGAITVALIKLFEIISRKSKQRKFKSIFGEDSLSQGAIHLVYAQLALRRDLIPSAERYTYVKPGEEASGNFFSIDRPVSSCELRAAKYLAETFGKEVNRSPILSSDLEINGRLNLSFIAFGGRGSNHKSRDALNNDSNIFLDFDYPSFVTRQGRRPVFELQEGFDYGLILKIPPSQFPERTWIVCAGLGEWGTSGAAWYLAYKWQEIYKYVKSGHFAIVVRARFNQDESAEPVIRLKSAEDLVIYTN